LGPEWDENGATGNAKLSYEKTWWPGTELNRRRQPFQVFFGPKPFFDQQLNPSRWPSYCDHSVTSADVRLSVGPNLSRPGSIPVDGGSKL
jgi:hypothetical protein